MSGIFQSVTTTSAPRSSSAVSAAAPALHTSHVWPGAAERGGHHLGHARLVVDDEHSRRVAHAARRQADGEARAAARDDRRRRCARRAPRRSGARRRGRARCRSGRVVKNGSNTRARSSGAMPAPRSRDRELDPAVRRARADRDLAARRRRLDRVREQPDEHLADEVAVGVDDRQRRRPRRARGARASPRARAPASVTARATTSPMAVGRVWSWSGRANASSELTTLAEPIDLRRR